MTLIVVQCTREHIPQLVELWGEYLIDQGDDPLIKYIDQDNSEGYRNILENYLKREPEGFHVAINSGEVVGFSVSHRDALGPNYKTTKRIGTVQIIHTKRSHRNKGIATQLLSHALDYLKANNCTIILAETDQQNKASMNLLEKHGFKQRGNHVTLILEELKNQP